MSKPKLLIVGDSFSADKHPKAWQNLLINYDIDNVSSAGSSEYRILKKLLSKDLDQYDAVIVVHTSPNRIYVEHNPLHQSSLTHRHCDLIYEDVRAQRSDPWADHATWWFEHVFDVEHAHFVHQLLVNHSMEYTSNHRNLHLTFFDLDCGPTVMMLHDVWKNHPGDINHLSAQGNQLVADLVGKKL